MVRTFFLFIQLLLDLYVCFFYCSSGYSCGKGAIQIRQPICSLKIVQHSRHLKNTWKMTAIIIICYIIIFKSLIIHCTINFASGIFKVGRTYEIILTVKLSRSTVNTKTLSNKVVQVSYGLTDKKLLKQRFFTS